MQEHMIELLSYEPFDRMEIAEVEYINQILNKNYAQPASVYSDLFGGFYNYVTGIVSNFGWLVAWYQKYYAHNQYNATAYKMRTFYPVLFKKICFYCIIKYDLQDKEFMGMFVNPNTAKASSLVNRLRKWGLSPQYRKYAEASTYSAIKSYRNGTKKEYLLYVIKKLYYEAGRQQSGSQILKDIPCFVDVMAGSGNVSASVVTYGMSRPVLNDYDPLQICFIWAFTYYQKEIRSRLAKMHNNLMKADFDSIEWSYTELDYINHYGYLYSYATMKDSQVYDDIESQYWEKESLCNEAYWDNPLVQSMYTKQEINKGKQKAKFFKEFIIRIRSSYLDAENIVKNCNRDALRKVDFNLLPKTDTDATVEELLNYAIAYFYYFSFKPTGRNGGAFHVSCVDVDNYYRYVHMSLGNKVMLPRGIDITDKAKILYKLRLKPASMNLEYKGSFRTNLKDARLSIMDFRKLLNSSYFNGIYYFDSEYFLTAGYEIDFTDDMHKEMLDWLRKSTDKWIFSMQYNPSSKSSSVSPEVNAKRNRGGNRIKDYGTYYRGFIYSLIVDENGYYIPDIIQEREVDSLQVLLLDFDKVIDRVDVADVVDYVKIEPEYFEIKLVNNDKIHVVYWRNLSENPSVPSRIVMKNKSRDNILFFLYDIIAEFAYDGARDKGMPHDSTIERLKEMYPSYKTYCRNVSLKYLGCQILSNYK